MLKPVAAALDVYGIFNDGMSFRNVGNISDVLCFCVSASSPSSIDQRNHGNR